MREVRHALGIRPVYKTVDTCAAEFAAKTPYFYSSYDEETEVAPREKPAVIILGSGPNRIGQGIEFDYSCVHASFALQRRRLRDRDGQLQPRDRLHRLRHLRPALLRAAHAGGRAGDRPRRDRRPARSPASSSSSAARPRWASRRRSRTTACRSSAPRPRRSTSPRTAAPSAGSSPRPGCPPPSTAPPPPSPRPRRIADEIGYPVLVRPSYVLGGRGMEIVYDETRAGRRTSPSPREISPTAPGPGRPLPRRRHRDRRRRALRRPGALPRRRHGAHRGGRHPLRRLGLRAAPDHPRRLRHQAAARLHRGHRARASASAD